MVSRLRSGRWAGTAAGLVADRVLGEPALDPHPVAAFGSLMARVERRLWRDDRVAGVVHAAVGVGVGVAAGLPGRRSPLATAASTYLAVASRNLGDTAAEIGAALDRDDLDRARALLPSLVGRDPSGLDADEVARAVVESVAENSVDAVVAPALWAAAAGAPGALGFRAVNTLDSMVGHRSARYERYGWASARLDDVAGFVPARATALLVAACRPDRAGEVLRTVRRDAPAHPSPNAGVAEAAFAAALGVRLGGANRYGARVEERGRLGDGPPPTAADIGRAVDLLRDVTLLLAGGLAVGAAVQRRRGAGA
jgi:adenosylcobinamide-phosphate synthase